jgi:hypothetical protein
MDMARPLAVVDMDIHRLRRALPVQVRCMVEASSPATRIKWHLIWEEDTLLMAKWCHSVVMETQPAPTVLLAMVEKEEACTT